MIKMFRVRVDNAYLLLDNVGHFSACTRPLVYAVAHSTNNYFLVQSFTISIPYLAYFRNSPNRWNIVVQRGRRRVYHSRAGWATDAWAK